MISQCYIEAMVQAHEYNNLNELNFSKPKTLTKAQSRFLYSEASVVRRPELGVPSLSPTIIVRDGEGLRDACTIAMRTESLCVDDRAGYRAGAC